MCPHLRSSRRWPAKLALALAVLAGGSTSRAAEPKGQHVLDPVIAWAEASLKRLDAISDYTALLVKRERVGGKLGPYQRIELKVRHQPFSVYMRFVSPDDLRGREVIYIDGQNDNHLLAHEDSLLTGWKTWQLKPDGHLAMRGQRYPITEVGLKNLSVKLIERAQQQREFPGQVDVRYYKGARVENRPAWRIEVIQQDRNDEVPFRRADVFIDQELRLPIRYASYAWPERDGGAEPLIEEYNYLHLRLNPGLTDEDFDVENPEYDFP